MNGSFLSVASLLSIASLIALAACTNTTQGVSPGSDAGAGSDAAAVREVPSLSCLQILQCGVDCPTDNNEACLDACGNKGTEEGKTNVVALATCNDKEKCTEATCLKEKCATELDACITSSAPKAEGTPLEGPAPPGSVPTDLAGTWAGARDGITQRLIMNSDGTGSWTTSVASQQSSSCFNFTRMVRSGNVVVSDPPTGQPDGEIAIHATNVIQQVQQCKPPTEDTQQPSTTERLKWHRAQNGDPNTIMLIDSTCAAKYPGTENCNTLGCPIGLYCTSRLTRE